MDSLRMTEQAESIDQEVRAFLVEATLAGQSTDDMTKAVLARWGAAGVTAAQKLAEELVDALPRSERRRLKL
jgi:hypothetical protein